MSMREEFEVWWYERAIETSERRSFMDMFWIIWQAAYAAGLERAAKACEAERVAATRDDEDHAYNGATEDCAAAIRSIDAQEPA